MLRAGIRDLLSNGLAGDGLVGAEVHDGAEFLILIDPRVEPDNRNIRLGSGLHRTLHGIWVHEGSGDAIDFAVYRVLNERGLTRRRWISGVLEVDVVLGGRGSSSATDLVPTCRRPPGG